MKHNDECRRITSADSNLKRVNKENSSHGYYQHITAGVVVSKCFPSVFNYLMLQPRSSSLMPEWYREYLAFVSKGNMDPQQFSLLFFLSKFYNAKLYYTICSRIVPLSYLATFEDTVIVFKYTSYPSEGCIICVSTVRECITALFTVRKGQLIYDESFTLIVHDQILDLSCQGDRWEGDVLDNEPFGWGDLYDADNHHVYRGFLSGSTRICYGIEYHQIACEDVIMYCGNWSWNVRSGYGQVFDRNGSILYEGEWIDDQLQVSSSLSISESSPFQSLSSLVEDIVIGNHCCNSDHGKRLDLQFLVRLRNLSIGNECFCNCDTVIVSGLKQLQRCVIGSKSFSLEGSTIHENNYRSLYITHCPQLREILIGNRSFADYYVCDIRCLPTLKSLYIGNDSQWSYCFKYCPQLHICDFPMLECLYCGGNSFLCVHSVRFESILSEMNLT